MDLETAISSNQKLIYSLTNYFTQYRNKEDLYQAGVLGLIKAYHNFDASKETKFSTYAYSYILGEMKKYVREDKGIKLSRSHSILNLKIEKAYVLLTQRLMREPTTAELAGTLGIKESYVTEALKTRNLIESIDKPVNEELSLHEILSSDKTDINTLLALKEELMSLDKNESNLIKHRYIDDMTQSETASIMGISQVQVSRNEQKILKKIRQRIS